MKVTEILKETDKLTSDFIASMVVEECRGCGCPRCLKISKAIGVIKKGTK